MSVACCSPRTEKHSGNDCPTAHQHQQLVCGRRKKTWMQRFPHRTPAPTASVWKKKKTWMQRLPRRTPAPTAGVWKKKKNSDATTALPHTSTNSWCVEEEKKLGCNDCPAAHQHRQLVCGRRKKTQMQQLPRRTPAPTAGVWKKKKNSDATTALPHTSTNSWCVEEEKKLGCNDCPAAHQHQQLVCGRKKNPWKQRSNNNCPKSEQKIAIVTILNKAKHIHTDAHLTHDGTCILRPASDLCTKLTRCRWR
jgi:hypothetical protein